MIFPIKLSDDPIVIYLESLNPVLALGLSLGNQLVLHSSPLQKKYYRGSKGKGVFFFRFILFRLLFLN